MNLTTNGPRKKNGNKKAPTSGYYALVTLIDILLAEKVKDLENW